MSETDHWHPVAFSEDLGRTPMGVTVAGREIVLFRTQTETLGALTDRCPHRGMRLSCGSVEGEKIVCPYHGWRWGTDGRGTAPGTPTAKPIAEHYCVVERLGAVWVKSSRSTVAFPQWDVEGWRALGRIKKRIPAPLELVLDNFIEVEHTPTTHALLGYPIEKMSEVECVTTVTDQSVRVYNRGPQRALPWAVRKLLRITDRAHFIDDWTTYFSPVYTVYNQYWIDPVTTAPSPEALRIAVFFNPVAPAVTELMVFVHARTPVWSRVGIDLALGRVIIGLVEMEINRDAAMLSRLADHEISLKSHPPRSLGRFDKAIVAARARLESNYRGG